MGWVALSSVFRRSVVPHRWHLLSSPLYDVSKHTNHIFSVRIWSWQHVSVNISFVAELSPVYCCLVVSCRQSSPRVKQNFENDEKSFAYSRLLSSWILLGRSDYLHSIMFSPHLINISTPPQSVAALSLGVQVTITITLTIGVHDVWQYDQCNGNLYFQ